MYPAILTIRQAMGLAGATARAECINTMMKPDNFMIAGS